MTPPSSLTASYPTDYWRKPPSTNVHNAPTFLRQVDSLNFHRARVTVSADWVRLYDQGGLFVEFPPRDDHHHSQGEGQGEYKRFWLKTGIEFYNDIPNLSTVSAHFPPELINRLDSLTVFNKLARPAILEVVDLRLRDVAGRLARERRVRMEVGEEARKWLAERGYSDVYGARAIARVVRTEVLFPLAQKLLSGTIR